MANVKISELAAASSVEDGDLFETSEVQGNGSFVSKKVTAAQLRDGLLPTAGGTMTGALAVAAGTVSAPGLAASGDSNTGIFFPAADTIAFAEGGVEAMRITADGHVGIGTSTPAEPFHVAGSARFGASASQNTGTAVIYADGNNVTIEAHAGDNFAVKRSLLLQTYGGTVGIGTETAPVTLTISGSDAMLVPVGTTAQRPTGAAGYFRYNSTTGSFEGHNGTAWGSIGASGTVTSVDVSGGTTGLTATGGPVTSSGTLTLGGTLAIANGGTGATTAGAALTALGGLPLAGGTLTGALAVTAGTVSAPGIAASGDTNTGIFFPAADVIAFTEGGVEAMRLDSSGQMGLGTASPAARFDLAGDYKEGVVTANTGASYTINLASGTVQNLTLTENCAFTFPAATTAGRSFFLFLRQDGTGSRTVTWPGTVKWPAGTAPTITATASRTDILAFTADGSAWFGRVIAQNYS